MDRVMSSVGLGSALDRRDDGGSEAALSGKERVLVTIMHLFVGVVAVQALRGGLVYAAALVLAYAALFAFGTWKRRQRR